MITASLIVAAGRGSRAGDGIPKQYRTIGGEPVLRRTIQAMLASDQIDMIRVVIHPDDQAYYEETAPDDPRIAAPILSLIHI